MFIWIYQKPFAFSVNNNNLNLCMKKIVLNIFFFFLFYIILDDYKFTVHKLLEKGLIIKESMNMEYVIIQ